MKLDAAVLANLPRSLELSFTCTVGELLDAMSRSGDVPEFASTVELARAWGLTARKWREGRSVA